MNTQLQAAIAINEMALPGKLPKGDKRWAEFNRSFHNERMTPEQLASSIQTGHAYTSWHDPEYRHSDNWVKCQFIAVDMDTEDERSTFDALLDRNLVLAYATLLHTTPSHTPQKPRCRAIFYLDEPIEKADGYSAACAFLGDALGGDGCCHDPSRFFYGAKDCEIEVIGSVMPLDLIRKLYKRQHKFEVKHQRPRSKERAPETPDEQYQRVADALGTIQPWDVPYDDWFSLICAIKNILGDSGRTLAIQWGQGKEGEVEKLFDRYLKRQTGKLPGMGTIMHFASLQSRNAQRVDKVRSQRPNVETP